MNELRRTKIVATLGPSTDDQSALVAMIRAGDMMKITVVDHIILGRATIERPRDFVSMRELGYFHT